jgi:hypothetical protein
MSDCLETAQVLARRDGPRLIMQAITLGIRACRCDVETECVQVTDEAGLIWWDTSKGMFDGPCDNDLEFRAMRDEAIRFLDDFGQFVRHPVHSHLIRFPAEPLPITSH